MTPFQRILQRNGALRYSRFQSLFTAFLIVYVGSGAQPLSNKTTRDPQGPGACDEPAVRTVFGPDPVFKVIALPVGHVRNSLFQPPAIFWMECLQPPQAEKFRHGHAAVLRPFFTEIIGHAIGCSRPNKLR